MYLLLKVTTSACTCTARYLSTTTTKSIRPLIAVFAPDTYPLPICDEVDLFHVSNDVKKNGKMMGTDQDTLLQKSKAIIWVASKDPKQLDNLINLWPKFNEVTWVHSIFSECIIYLAPLVQYYFQ